MQTGALLTPAGDQPDHLVNEARAIESAGFDSIWSAHAMGRGFMMHDPLLALTAAAAVMTRVELGSGILQLPLYQPADVILKVLTLMQIAGDRLLLGVGAGSTQADYALHEQDFRQRFQQLEVSLESLRQGFESGQSRQRGCWVTTEFEGGDRRYCSVLGVKTLSVLRPSLTAGLHPACIALLQSVARR